jgi:hypothetical protein
VHDAVAVKEPGFCFALPLCSCHFRVFYLCVCFYFANCLAALQGRDRNGRVCAGEGEMVAVEVAASWRLFVLQWLLELCIVYER